ncbi:MAG TPA: DedA family protein [Aquificae bacterium]|nr:DedA family protein [Aquificota bacterium]
MDINKFIVEYGYFAIFFFMVIESSFIPFPSEVVMIPAGYFASQGKLNLFLSILIGAFGSLVGAWINYFLALKFGRPFIVKVVPKNYLLETEKIFHKYENFSIFIGRFVPGIRQYISLPAGLFQMNFFTFSILTFLGAFIWCSILAFFGYYLGINYSFISEYKKIFFIFLIFTLFLYFLYKIKSLK